MKLKAVLSHFGSPKAHAAAYFRDFQLFNNPLAHLTAFSQFFLLFSARLGAIFRNSYLFSGPDSVFHYFQFIQGSLEPSDSALSSFCCFQLAYLHFFCDLGRSQRHFSFFHILSYS